MKYLLLVIYFFSTLAFADHCGSGDESHSEDRTEESQEAKSQCSSMDAENKEAKSESQCSTKDMENKED